MTRLRVYVEVVTGAVLDGGQLTALAERLTVQPGVEQVQTTAGSLGDRYSTAASLTLIAAAADEASQHAAKLLTTALAELGVSAGTVIATGLIEP